MQAGVLKPIQMHSAPQPEYADAGRPLQAHPVSDGEFYGVSDVEEIPSRSLSLAPRTLMDWSSFRRTFGYTSAQS